MPPLVGMDSVFDTRPPASLADAWAFVAAHHRLAYLRRLCSRGIPVTPVLLYGARQEEGPMSNEGYHEPIDELSDETRDMHRAIVSLMEELEAMDWYHQRIDACKDAELKKILAHNRDEEKEHAAMLLEWIRRRDTTFDKELKDYLFTDKAVAHE